MSCLTCDDNLDEDVAGAWLRNRRVDDLDGCIFLDDCFLHDVCELYVLSFACTRMIILNF
jgi:hypothetical protein